MLGKTAGGLYWMFRSLERAENTARLVEAGFRIALTRSTSAEMEWKSVIVTSAAQAAYEAKYTDYDAENVVNFLLRDGDNPSSVLSVVRSARDNARLTRTGLTSEVWTAVNETWMVLTDLLKEPVAQTELPSVLNIIRLQSANVRGALHGTMLRNDIYDFCRLGTFVERIDSTARIIDVKYYALLPATSSVGSRLDNVQWETILRSVSAHRSYRWANDDDINAAGIANFLILDGRMPRSLRFCAKKLVENLEYLGMDDTEKKPSLQMAEALHARLKDRDIDSIFEEGLHEFLLSVIAESGQVGLQIEEDYRFNK
ncbi:MAG: alpha-E domain-containing protein [Pseudomonadota bacterium]